MVSKPEMLPEESAVNVLRASPSMLKPTVSLAENPLPETWICPPGGTQPLPRVIVGSPDLGMTVTSERAGLGVDSPEETSATPLVPTAETKALKLPPEIGTGNEYVHVDELAPAVARVAGLGYGSTCHADFAPFHQSPVEPFICTATLTPATPAVSELVPENVRLPPLG